ncbi:HD-GYP domain-containing protein [Gimesia fumaroli]|uniref:Cyclic di-GMP phosphodiesterase response regulator RpfG n=1 Tax=Gimesia fumaroli TaxID=2527976 RepID=A0A518IBV0_9PLAN|nr:HD-GYP domain-containing protein [Gimesia fumaroli]QDV50574.1 Cyclic di-GMP phosphodiesterase response regulator RpfG [Gimesia fumaroli]
MALGTTDSLKKLSNFSKCGGEWDLDLHQDAKIDLAIRRMRHIAELTGLTLFCFDSNNGIVLDKTNAQSLPFFPVDILNEIQHVDGLTLIENTNGVTHFLLPLVEDEAHKITAAGFVFSKEKRKLTEMVLTAVQREWAAEELDAWLENQRVLDTKSLHALLSLALLHIEEEQQLTVLNEEVDNLSECLDETFEEISLLHEVAQHLKISESPEQLGKLCLDRIGTLIEAETNIIWFEGQGNTSQFMSDSTSGFDEVTLARLVAQFDGFNWNQPLVINQVESSLLSLEFPDLHNLVLVPISDGFNSYGWILSCNLLKSEEYGTIQASLLNSVASFLGTHLRNIDLYAQQEELMLSFVKSFISTLDAKDPYTRGHSERVALIAQKLAKQLGYSGEFLQNIYLSGLLHDIGKIGVDDGILRKEGKLTDEEFAQIQKHPMIGYKILSGIKKLKNILPGIRNHHEQIDGLGYPDRLKGTDIPLMARIIAVADAYDAMGSDRPYRNGMPLERLEIIFREGKGFQWDSDVIDAYFEIRDEIIQLSQKYNDDAAALVENSRN